MLPYKHHPKYKFVLDLRAFGRGRKFFKTKVAAEAERMRQKTALERTAGKRSGYLNTSFQISFVPEKSWLAMARRSRTRPHFTLITSNVSDAAK